MNVSTDKIGVIIVMGLVVAALLTYVFYGVERPAKTKEEYPVEFSSSVEYSSSVDEKVFSFKVANKMLAECDDVDLSKPLPLSIQDAVAKADQALALYVPRNALPDWQVTEVSLCRHARSSKWHYMVGYAPRTMKADYGVFSETLRIPVLLNGTVVRGVRRKDYEKENKEYLKYREMCGQTPWIETHFEQMPDAEQILVQ